MINFIKKRRLWYSISGLIIAIGLAGMLNNLNQRGHVFNLGIDFTGGTSLIIRFEKPSVTIESSLRDILVGLSLDKHTIQSTGSNDIIIKTQDMDVEKRNALFGQISSNIGAFEVLEVDIIGPSIGDQLRTTSMVIILFASIAILFYCSWRFELVFGIASIIALLHDTVVLLSLSALLQLEINTAYVAALLTVLGYSINDTIVIFDRIREKLRQQKDPTLWSKSVLNTAVNNTLARSIHTSVSTGLVVGAIYFFGGLSLKVFSAVLMMGLFVGTYSSLFIASPMIITILKLRGATIDK